MQVTSVMYNGDNHGHEHDHNHGFDDVSLDQKNLKVVSVLGRGAKGVVFLVQTEGRELLALKAILREKINEETRSEYCRRICFERQVLRCLQHPLLPKLRGVLSAETVVGYAIDYCPGGNLNSLRQKQTEKMFSDDIIRFYAAELVLALDYLHGKGIVYRDLKPENVMIQENGHLMLVDFDLSTKQSPKNQKINHSSTPEPDRKPNREKKNGPFHFYTCCSGISPDDSVKNSCRLGDAPVSSESDSVQKCNSFVGTEEYVAPEIIIGNGHDFAVDWWSFGVMLYEMLYGTTPFKGKDRKDTFYRILQKSPELTGEPTPLRDLIRKLLEKDPKMRTYVDEIKRHDFFEGVDWDFVLEIRRPPFIFLRREIEDMEGIKEIDLENFVHGVFKDKVGK